MWLRRVPPPVWADNIAEAFAFLHDEGGASFNLTLHPWIAGQAHRIRWLREALSRVLGRGTIWRDHHRRSGPRGTRAAVIACKRVAFILLEHRAPA